MFDEDYGRGRGNLLFNEYGVSVQEDGKILKTDGGEVCKTVCEESIRLNCTYKVAKMVNFIFYQKKILKKKSHTQYTTEMTVI